MLELSDLTKTYPGVRALDRLNLSINRGEFFGLLGPNGAGKSTLMSLLCGYRAPDAGAIRLGGQPFGPGSLDLRRRIGLVPQAIALYEELTAEENLRVFGRLAGLGGRRLAGRVDEALAAVQLQDRRRDRVKTYSGGMQRRLNLAAALLHEPDLLLCDEPTVGVDPHSRHAIFELLERINRTGTTIVYSTHYMEEAQRLCSRIGVIDHGRILALGATEELLARLPFEEEIAFPASALADAPALARLCAETGRLERDGDTCVLRPGPGFRLSTFFAATEAHALPSRLFAVRRPTLEQLFLHLTGRSLRDQ